MSDPVEKARWKWIGALNRFESIAKNDEASQADYEKAKEALQRAKNAYDQLVEADKLKTRARSR